MRWCHDKARSKTSLIEDPSTEALRAIASGYFFNHGSLSSNGSVVTIVRRGDQRHHRSKS